MREVGSKSKARLRVRGKGWEGEEGGGLVWWVGFVGENGGEGGRVRVVVGDADADERVCGGELKGMGGVRGGYVALIEAGVWARRKG